MGREFMLANGLTRARWGDNDALYPNNGAIPAQDIPAFIEWLKAGPPKPKWRITREFDESPWQVITTVGGLFGCTIPLTDADVERVTP